MYRKVIPTFTLLLILTISTLLSPQIVQSDTLDVLDLPMDQLLDMKIDDLMELKVSNVASLTVTTARKIPAATTRITAADIEESGARSLHELLDIYVPNVQWVRHHWEFSDLGARGIISDREDKVMIRVNGRVMNERMHIGAIAERNFPMLQDIHRIDVVRGPGSSLYGLGAVSMVIDIHTHSAQTMDGAKLNMRGGLGYAFQSLEGQFGKKLDDETGVWFYAAVADVDGANESDAPLILGLDANSNITGEFIEAGDPFPAGVNDGIHYKSNSPAKIHFQVNNKNTDFWIRYTRAGESEPADVFFIADVSGIDPPDSLSNKHFYNQLTAFFEHRYQIKNDLSVKGVLSYDKTQLIRNISEGLREPSHYLEKEWFSKLVLDWSVDERSDVVMGIEFSNEQFTLPGAVEAVGNESIGEGNAESWRINTLSLFSEWQWRPAKKLTMFMGGRIDKSTYSDVLFSPRVSWVWTADERNTWKLLASRSQRRNFAEENRIEAMAGNRESRPETLDSLELRYEHTQKNQRFAASLFNIDLHAIGWDEAVRRSVLIGNQQQWGMEIEWERFWDDASFSISHSYTKLLDFELIGTDTLITAEPFGFGDDLNNWSNHITKIRGKYKVDDKLSLNASLRAYWGFPGLQDSNDRLIASGSPFINPDWNKASKGQYFLNMGGSYQLNKNSKINLNFYNLLGLFDKDHNKRIYLNSLGDYRSEAPAATLSIELGL